MSNEDLRNELPYTREEMARIIDESPTSGPICPRCRQHIPSFAELAGENETRVRALIQRGERAMATKVLRELMGCPLSWAKLWVLHEGRPSPPAETAPCPYCGKP